MTNLNGYYVSSVYAETMLQKQMENKTIVIKPVVSKGRVTKVKKVREDNTCLIQGVKGPDQHYVESDPMIRGSNGRFRK